MAIQTAYAAAHSVGYPGQLADGNPTEIVSLVAEGNIPMGSVVKKGTSDNQVLVGGPLPIGIAVRSLDVEADIYAATQVLGVLKKGYIYLTIANTGAKAAALKIVDATGVISVGTASTGESQLPAVLDQTLGAAGVARCRVDF